MGRNRNVSNMIDQVRADCASGAPGAWAVARNGDVRELRDGKGDLIMSDKQFYPTCPWRDADWSRVARVPEMEVALLAAEQLSAAVAAYDADPHSNWMDVVRANLRFASTVIREQPPA